MVFNGWIIRYLQDKRCGWIRPDHAREQVFFHFDSLCDITPDLVPATGMRVQYRVGTNARGPVARHVRILENLEAA
jgi:cold shock CspA family protein